MRVRGPRGGRGARGAWGGPAALAARPRVAGLAARPLAALAALAAALVLAAAGCSYSVVVGTPTPVPTATGDRPALASQVPIEPTPWPNGTVGANGLHIDPSLLSNIPSVVGGNPLVEDVYVESAALDAAQYAASFSAFYAAHIGQLTDLNFVQVTVAALQPDAQTQDFYTSWRDDWFQAACSQAGGVGSTAQERINDWPVDIATCTGGVDAYTLNLENGILVSIVDLGPRRLGRQLIQGIQ